MSLSVPVRLRIRFILYKHFLYHKNNPLALPLVYRTNTRARAGENGRRSLSRTLTEAVLLQYYLFESPLRLPALRRRAAGPSPYARGAPRELRPACAKKGLNTRVERGQSSVFVT